MTEQEQHVDREQVRRDAQKFPDRETVTNWLIHKLAQAERDAEAKDTLATAAKASRERWKSRAEQAERVLARIADPSYVGNYSDAEVVEIYRKWAKG